MTILASWALAGAMALAAAAAAAAEYPAAKEGTYVARGFKVRTGEVLPEDPAALPDHRAADGEPMVVWRHRRQRRPASSAPPLRANSSARAGRAMPRNISSSFPTPSGTAIDETLRRIEGKFPKYNSEDMVDGQHRLLSEGLGLKRVRLIIGNSMGGFHVWVWGGRYPEFADALVPMASQPTPMASRNWMLRRLKIEMIRNDPGYNNGDYTEQPKSMKLADVFYTAATNGGTLALQKAAPTRVAADKLVDERLKAPFTADANDYIWAWDSSAAYDPTPGLEKTTPPCSLSTPLTTSATRPRRVSPKRP